MPRSIASITLVMREHDEAIQFFTEALRFELLEDTPLGYGKRWVRVAQSGSNRSCLLLARAAILNNWSMSEIKPTAACFSSWRRTTFEMTTDACKRMAFGSPSNSVRNLMGV